MNPVRVVKGPVADIVAAIGVDLENFAAAQAIVSVADPVIISPVAEIETSKLERLANVKSLPSEYHDLEALYDLMLEEGLDVIELQENGVRIRLTRNPHSHSPGSAPSSSAAVFPVAELPSAAIPSSQPSVSTPLAGVFYRASSPTSAPFVKENDVVEAGQTLCIVEAMKVMNEIKAENRCRIVKILAENSRPVTAGQPLFLVEPLP